MRRVFTGFRQADIRNILDFEQHFPNAKVILLEQNYRSTQTILDVADAIIENNVNQKKKKLWTANPGGERCFITRHTTATARRDLSRRRSRSISGGMRTTASRSFIAPTRSRGYLRSRCAALRIDYNIVGGFSFYERAEVKDVIAYLKLAMNPFDDIALLRVINTPPRGLGKTSLDELQRLAKDRRRVAVDDDRADHRSGIPASQVESYAAGEGGVSRVSEKRSRH